MDNDALDVLAAAVGEGLPLRMSMYEIADAGLAALGANGYVVVPRHEWEALLAAGNGSVEAFRSRRMNTAAETLSSALAAVVEAVGPTT